MSVADITSSIRCQQLTSNLRMGVPHVARSTLITARSGCGWSVHRLIWGRISTQLSQRNSGHGCFVVTLSQRPVRYSCAGPASGGPPPTSPAPGWQVRPDALAFRWPGTTGSSGGRWLWRRRAPGVTVVIRGQCPPWWCPACIACGVFSYPAVSPGRGKPGRLAEQAVCRGDSAAGMGLRRSHQH